MKLHRYTKIVQVSIWLLLLAFATTAEAQVQGHRWHKYVEGDHYSSGNLMSKVLDSYVDNMGNSYIFGQYGNRARLGEENGPYICPMDSLVSSQSNPGVFLAKIDSVGNILWHKAARSSNSHSFPWNMVVKDNKITIAFTMGVYPPNHPWIYFFDTLITSPAEHFYLNGSILGNGTTYTNYFVTFDLDGNRTDLHEFQLFALTDPELELYWSIKFASGQRFGIDEDGNIHLFTQSSPAIESSEHKAFIIVDGDTNRKYLQNVPTLNDMFYSSTVYYKISRDWDLVNYRHLIDTIVGWCPEAYGIFANLKFEQVISTGGDMYVSGSFQAPSPLADADTILVRVYLDSVHYIKVETKDAFRSGFLPFIFKMNKSGDIEWLQQLYTEPGLNPTVAKSGGIAVDEENVYYNMEGAFSGTGYYIDNAHTINIPLPNLSDFDFIVAYNRNTGATVDYYLPDTANMNRSHGSLFVHRDEILTDAVFCILHKCELKRINKHTKEVSASFLISFGWVPDMGNNFSVSSSGWVFRANEGENAYVEDSIFVGNYAKASVWTFYYDSSLDDRIKPCPAVDSLWVDGQEQRFVTLAWSSPFDHSAYELAYMPQGSSWDNATIIQTDSPYASIALPDDQCYLFRARGLCNGKRNPQSPWCDPITLCPEVSIDTPALANFGLSVSPNPVRHTLKVCTSADVQGSLEIYNAEGQRLLSFPMDGREARLDVSRLPSGQYLLSLRTRESTSSAKFVKR